MLDRDPGLERRRARLKALAARLAKLDWARIDERSVAAAVAHSERRLARARERIALYPGEDACWHTLRRRLRRLHQQHNLLRRIAPAWRLDAHATTGEATRLGEAQDDVLLLRNCRRNSPFAPGSRARLCALASERLGRVRGVGASGNSALTTGKRGRPPCT